ncbi:hypothetical protein H5410_043395, partial [Solanum commersonii]
AVPTHGVTDGLSGFDGVVMEIVITFAPVYTVYATAADPKKGSLGTIAPIAIGLIWAMSPSRSFGPAVVSGEFSQNWIYWVRPLIDGGLVGLIYDVFIGSSHDPLSFSEDYAKESV